MWMKLVCGLLVLASVNADDVANVAPETDTDASMPPNVIPGFDGKLPTAEDLLEMLDSLSGLPDEEKEKLREDLLSNVRSGGFQQPVAGGGLPVQTLVLLSLLGLVALIFESVQEKLLSLIPDEAKGKLSNLFQRYQELDDDEKQQLLDELIGKFKQSLHDQVYSNTSTYAKLLYSHSYIVFLFAVLFVVLVLVFFVYKLFKCLSERRMKREEKKKNKQMKKKK